MNIHAPFKAAAAPVFPPNTAPKQQFMDSTRQKYLDGKITQVELAIEIAWYVHQDEPRRSGEPYFNHVWHVAHPETYYPHLNIPNTEAGIIRGLLHDVLERKFDDPKDNWSADDLRYMGLDEQHVEDIIYLTKQPGDLDFDYAVRMSQNPRAMETKLVDNTDNQPDARPMKKEIYTRTILYYLACLNNALRPGADIASFCYEAGLYNPPLFEKYYSKPFKGREGSGSFIGLNI